MNNKMTYKEIIQILRENINRVSEFAYEDYDKEELEKILGEFDEINQYGGEGKGDEWYSVKYFKDHDVYIRVDGWYSSYNGVDFDAGWDCCKEVRPIERMVTFYE